jgi:hypothetical protein
MRWPSTAHGLQRISPHLNRQNVQPSWLIHHLSGALAKWLGERTTSVKNQ